MTALRPKTRRLLAWLALPLLLAACEEQPGAIRPGTQPLERLVTAEARRRAQAQAVVPADARGSAGMCAEVLRVSEQGRLILDRTQPGRLLVNQDLWGRVPAAAQQAIVRCAELAPAGNAPAGRLTVVPTAPAE